MSRSLTTILLPGLVALMLAACSSPRKASERACRKAEKHWAKAVWLCPKILSMDSATVTFVLPGDSVATTARYNEPIVDSVLKACEEYALAVMHERDSLRRQLLGDTGQVEDSSLVNGFGTRRGTSPAPSSQRQEKLREFLCLFEPIVANTELCYAQVRPGPNGPLLTLEQKEYREVVKAPCPPVALPPPCPPCDGVASWWRTVAIVLAILLLLVWGLPRARGVFADIRSKLPMG